MARRLILSSNRRGGATGLAIAIGAGQGARDKPSAVAAKSVAGPDQRAMPNTGKIVHLTAKETEV
ncbi:hypothetical protein So717_13650 [Roseobacter cerasinus]|uniref:Uncharacterized protein n=1 Tax=Roseobacter cerasinus TaxID=2602289 RepID=A0A640VPK2_9RHOB|nr:hypothetical protein So717_13650 [Roseobacter cerasinus]